MFRSDDGGKSWAPRNEGLEGLDVTDLDACRSVPSRLIAATANAGLYLSSDAGASWTRVAREAFVLNYRAQDSFVAATIDPLDPGHLVAAVRASVSYEIFESVDGGTRWRDAGAYPVTRFAFGVAGGRSTLYFSAADGRVYQLPSAGGTPVPLSGANPVGRSATPLVDLALPGGDGTALAVAQGGRGLWVSTDGGATWSERHFKGAANPNFVDVDAVSADPTDPGRLLYHVNDSLVQAETALYESGDLGLTRSALPLPEAGMEMGSPDVGGIYVTGGAEWLCESKAGLFRRDGAGAFAASSRGLAAYTARDLAFSPVEPGALAVAGGGQSEAGSGGVYLWDVPAADWIRRADGFPAGSSQLVRYQGEAAWLGVDGWGLYRSADGGLSWQDRNTGINDASAADLFYGLAFASSGGAGVVGTAAGVYRTSDGGLNWSLCGAIPVTGGWRIAGDGRSAQGFFVGGYDANGGRFYATVDGGATWEDKTGAALQGNGIDSLEASSHVGAHLLAGTQYKGLLESYDAGDSWGQVGNGFPADGKVNAVALGDDSSDRWMAAGVVGQGIFVSTNAGDSWVRVTGGLQLGATPFPLVHALRFEPGSGRLVAAVQDRGLWYVDLPPPVTIDAPLPGYTRDATPFLSYRAGHGAVEVTLTDDASGSATVLPKVSGEALDALRDGAYTLRVTAVDAAGNRGEDQVSFTVDTVAPQVEVIAPAAIALRDLSPELRYTVSDGAVVVKVDGSAVSLVSGDTLGPFDERAHVVRVEATDAAGNVGAAEVRFTVDTTPPVVTLTSPKAGITLPTGPMLEYSVDDATAAVVTTVDGSSVAVRSGSPLGDLSDGPHTVRVEATDAAGNVGWAEAGFEVDTSAPSVVISSPGAYIRTASPVLTYTALESTGTAVDDVVVRVDGVVTATVSDDLLGPLSDGLHTVRVEATGASGKVGSDEVTFTVDTVCQAPDGPFVPQQEASGTGTITVSWSASATPGATYELQEAPDEAFAANVQDVYVGAELSVTLTGRLPVATYYYRLRAVAEGYRPSAWLAGANGCRVLRGVAAAPGAPKVPVTRTKEGYTVSWKASKTRKVTYELLESTDPEFSEGPRVVHAGPKTSARVYGGSDGVTYFYRVRAVHPEYAASEPVPGGNGCALSLVTARPATLSVPRKSSTGAYTVKWGASSTRAVNYELEESPDSHFEQDVRTVYIGPDRSVPLSGRASGTYYYRVRASKDRYRSSEWRAASRGCLVALPLEREGVRPRP